MLNKNNEKSTQMSEQHFWVFQCIEIELTQNIRHFESGSFYVGIQAKGFFFYNVHVYSCSVFNHISNIFKELSDANLSCSLSSLPPSLRPPGGWRWFPFESWHQQRSPPFSLTPPLHEYLKIEGHRRLFTVNIFIPIPLKRPTNTNNHFSYQHKLK